MTQLDDAATTTPASQEHTRPAPRTQPLVGHLGRWGRDPLGLLEEGARLGPVFDLRLWRRTIVGYSPAWNQFVLGDLATFRSEGSMSGLSPYLGAGVVQLDEPEHRGRRRALNPAFGRRSVAVLADQIREVVAGSLPHGTFDAAAWASEVMREVLAVTFFGGQVPRPLLARFLAPLDRSLPSPFLRRPLLFRRMNAQLQHRIERAPTGSLAACFRGLPDGVDEMRVAISAGYDTTAHTIAWLIAHLAQDPELGEPDRGSAVVDEVLRLYPAGWLGSRRAAVDTEYDGVPVRRGSLVLYSPYLTHRDPDLWSDPLAFRPERARPADPVWTFIPFAAGERNCLGRSFARLVLSIVLEAMAELPLTFISGSFRPRAGITLVPSGPLLLRRA